MKTYPLPSELLPHEEPILFIDKIIDFQPNNFLIAEKYIKEGNEFFRGHFPTYPILPGVILIEALFQACSIFNRLEMMSMVKETGVQNSKKNNSGRAIKVDKFIFKEEIKPNTKLEIKVEIKKRIMKFSEFAGTITSNGKVVAQGILTTFIKENQ